MRHSASRPGIHEHNLSGTLADVSVYLVTESRVIDAAAQRLFDILADPAMHPRIDGSGTVRDLMDGAPERLALGAKFGMDMKIGAPYKITNTVVEFDEGRRIAWRHFNGHVWRYTFEPTDGGTLVTEEWDARPARSRLALVAVGWPQRTRRDIRATLERLDEFVTAEPVT
jgi:Polyketide cyclase / dehydrase and lipid transport